MAGYEESHAERVASSVINDVMNLESGFDTQMHSKVYALAAEGIGRPIYLQKQDAEESVTPTLCGIAIPCNEPGDKKSRVAIAFSTGNVYIVRPGEKRSEREKFHATFYPGNDPLAADYDSILAAQRGLIFNDLPHDKSKMIASTKPSQTEKAIELFLAAIQYGRQLSEYNDYTRESIVKFLGGTVAGVEITFDISDIAEVVFTPDS